MINNYMPMPAISAGHATEEKEGKSKSATGNCNALFKK